MSKQYYSYQFDMPYRPTYLRNWECPKYYCPNPRRRHGKTQIIANLRGHLIPGVPRPVCNPFGDYIGTWQLPKKITRVIANKLNGTTDKPAFMAECKRRAAGSANLKKKRKADDNPLSKTTDDNAKDENEKAKTVEAVQTEDTSKEPVSVPEETPTKVICPIHDF